MAADLERLAEQFAATKYPELAELLRAGATVARKLDAPESFNTAQAPDLFAKVYPEISLPEEHRRQGLVLAGRFAARLGLSEQAYIATLPGFSEKPSTYDKLRLIVPVIVETRISWFEAVQLSGVFIPDYMWGRISTGRVQDWKGINFDVPEVAFAAWFQDGTRFVNRRPSEAREELGRAGNEAYVAGSILPAISMQNVRPDMTITMFWNLIGTGIGYGQVPSLDRWAGRPELSASGDDNADPGYRALVFGREIRTL